MTSREFQPPRTILAMISLQTGISNTTNPEFQTGVSTPSTMSSTLNRLACQESSAGAFTGIPLCATRASAPTMVDRRYRGTSRMRNSPPPWDHHRALGIFLLECPRGALFLMSEVPLPHDADGAPHSKVQKFTIYPLCTTSFEFGPCRAAFRCDT